MSANSTEVLEVDRERDVLVTSFDPTMKFAKRRKVRDVRDAWHVFLGPELIELFDDREEAIRLARKVSAKTRRPVWISSDGVTFDAVESPAGLAQPLTRN